MSEIQFKSIMQLNNPLIIREITKSFNIDDKTAIKMFYNSSLYEKYLDEKGKGNGEEETIDTGEIDFPN